MKRFVELKRIVERARPAWRIWRMRLACVIIGGIWPVSANAAPPSPPESSTLFACTPPDPVCRPDAGYALTYHWDARPVDPEELVFVHFVGPDGKLAWNNDQGLPVPTAQWSGPVTDSQHGSVPADAAPGDYKILAGLYNPKTGVRQTLKTGPGVIDAGDRSYQVGVLHVARDAPAPERAAPALNLKGYHLTFDDEFNDLSVSAAGPGTRWFTATKETFGDARFVEQKDGFPFTVENGVLHIEARKDAVGWNSGLLASIDPQGNGFAQRFGYFEMRARFPAGPGTWPAFWLLGQPAQRAKSLRKPAVTNPEIDVVEQYGAFPRYIHTTVHLWYPDQPHWGKGDTFVVPDTVERFHTYGVMIENDYTAFYFDGRELSKSKTLPEAKVPLYVLVNLALGSGWPIDKTPNPSVMFVDSVRVYSRQASSKQATR